MEDWAMGRKGLTWPLFYARERVQKCKYNNLVARSVTYQIYWQSGRKKYSPGQLCASSRGKTEGASVVHDDWA